MKNRHSRLREIAIEKDEIEKLKKSRKNGKGSNTHKRKLKAYSINQSKSQVVNLVQSLQFQSNNLI
jgi:hypothetical protein